ncbi:MAG: hypothetical protein ILO36_05480 [Abditibacteriota bacterium]|nr:hypothetical protein [Abditibacteriota bacterium]
MTIEGIIKQLAKEKYGSLRAFCELEKLEYQTINKSLTRSVLRSSFKNTMRLCECLELDPYALSRGVAENIHHGSLSAEERKVLEAFRRASDRDKQIVDYVLKIPAAKDELRMISLPLYDLSVSAGPGNGLGDDDNDYEMIDVIYRPALRTADFCLTVMGDSMEPRYHDKDVVAVQESESLDYGDIGIFVLNGEGYMKVYDKDGLVSLNKKYETIPVGEGDTLSVVGKVLGKADLAE